jgi:hypothetical protein
LSVSVSRMINRIWARSSLVAARSTGVESVSTGRSVAFGPALRPGLLSRHGCARHGSSLVAVRSLCASGVAGYHDGPASTRPSLRLPVARPDRPSPLPQSKTCTDCQCHCRAGTVGRRARTCQPGSGRAVDCPSDSDSDMPVHGPLLTACQWAAGEFKLSGQSDPNPPADDYLSHVGT